jgi:enamine deaminase RidA (YjgF/YER057c/UK114 family)
MAERIRKRVAPKELVTPLMRYSPGIKVGPWVFVAGKTAGSFTEEGLAPEARPGLQNPDLQPNRLRLQALSILPNLKKVLDAGGSSMDLTVRMDDFIVSDDAAQDGIGSASEYLRARDELMPESSGAPASTTVGCSSLLCKPTVLEVDCIGVTKNSGWKKEVIRSSGVPVPPFRRSDAVRTGPYVFCSGALATDWVHGVAPPARTNAELRLGNDIEKQTLFILDQLGKVLEDAGSSLDLSVKAQVYLTAEGMRQISKFDEVWKEVFPKRPPARCITPAAWLVAKGCLVEINLVAVTKDGGIRPQVIRAKGVPKWPLHEPHAVRAGNLLFLSTGIAADNRGDYPRECRINPHYPWYEKGIRKQTEFILGNAEKIVKAAGGSGYENIIRRQAFHSDFDEFILCFETWRTRFPHDPPVSTTIEDSTVPLPVPGATLVLDLWAYLP